MKQKVKTHAGFYKTKADAKNAIKELTPQYQKTATVQKLDKPVNGREWGLFVLDYPLED